MQGSLYWEVFWFLIFPLMLPEIVWVIGTPVRGRVVIVASLKKALVLDLTRWVMEVMLGP